MLVGDVSAEDYPSIAGVANEILSGTGAQRTRWALAVLIQGIATTTAPADSAADAADAPPPPD